MWFFNREKKKRKRKNDESIYPAPPRFQVSLEGLVKISGVIIVLILCGACSSMLLPQVFNTFWGESDIEADLESQGQVPTLEVVPTPPPGTPDVWASHNWLSQAEAASLREHSNVNNLAFLEGGNVLYSTLTVPFTLDQGWQQRTIVPLDVTAMQVTDTYLVLQAAGQEYELNVLMPFVFVSDPLKIYLVDRESNVWQLDFSEASFVEAPGPLTIELAPNPNLSFTINER